LGSEYTTININASNALDDLYNNKKAYFTCPGILLEYFSDKEAIFKEAFCPIDSSEKMIVILNHMKVQAMIFLIGGRNTISLSKTFKDCEIYEDALSFNYFWPHSFTTGDADKFKSFIDIFKKY